MRNLSATLSATILVICGCMLMPRSYSLIDSLPTQLTDTGWLAFIIVRSDSFDSNFEFCNGVLIDSNWVLSSVGCRADPYQVVENLSPLGELTYYVQLLGEPDLFEIVKTVTSPDRRLVLHKLDRPAVVSPLKRSSQSAADLVGARVEVPGFNESENLGDPFYNPDGTIGASCRIGGELFEYDGSLCYILSPLFYYFSLRGITGTVVDPELSGSLTAPLDDELQLTALENELFIDFDAGSFPCVEDLGSPVVLRGNHEQQLVGIVTSVGIAAGLPLCANTLFNIYSPSSHYEGFIEETLLRDAFDSDCPAASRIRVEELEENTVRLYWDKRQGATGYKILFSPRLGYEPIQAIDIGNVTELSVPIDPDTRYYVSLVAYNDMCTSQPSDSRTVLLNKP